MTVIELRGRINESGQLEVALPEGLPPGEVRIRIELAELLRPQPMTGAEIVAAGLTGGWQDLGIEDGATWVEDVRRKRKARREW